MPTGIVIIDKPQDWTSMDVCAKLRGVFGEKRVGHGGTLDPMATGVLPVFVGRATRAVEFADTGEKEYLAALRLGIITNTQDVWGEVVERRTTTPPKNEAILTVLPRFLGEIEQIPPMFSAVKIQGEKLYKLARKGMEIHRPPRKITIYRLELLEKEEWLAQGGRSPGEPAPSPAGADDIFLRVRCSRGTYIRTLCHDIGQALGCGGCMASLRRASSCGFSLADAHPLEEVVRHPDPASLLLPVDRLFTQYKPVKLDEKAVKLAKNGNKFPCKAPDGTYRFYAPGGGFLLLGECRRGTGKTIKSFFEV